MILVNAVNSVRLSSMYTDKHGSFRFPVEQGVFDIGAFKVEYAPVWTRGVEVIQSDVSVEIELVPAAFVDDYVEDSGDCD